ncbi:MAG: hypothetical protein U5N56_06640 [Candidatus Marinimicrobia bacterium]|nr:hypothetical protein [Candidatus Neomarinimicrobiota bacterium]
MKLKTLLLFIALAMVFTACSVTQGLRQNVEVINNPSDMMIEVRGIEGSIYESDDQTKAVYFLRSFVSKEDNSTNHQVYVTCSYPNNWRTYFRATYPGGRHTVFESLDRSFEGTSYVEQMRVGITDDSLRKKTSGFSLIFYSETSNDFTIYLRKDQVVQQIAAVDSVIRSL